MALMGNKIYYKLIGEGASLVFIHGILGFWRNFYNISQAFKEDYSCLLYDQRGHGQSIQGEPYTVEQLSQDLKELLDFLNCRPVVLVGHSLGGYVACFLAHQYPEYVKKIVVVDSNPWPSKHSGEKIKNLLSNLPPSFSDRSQAKEFFKQAVAKNIFSQVMADFLIANLEKKSQGPLKFMFDAQGILKCLSSIREDVDFSSLIKSLKVPTLFLRGEHSTHFLKSDYEKTLKLNPLITGKEIKNSGHWIHSEQAPAFIEVLKEFLKARPSA